MNRGTSVYNSVTLIFLALSVVICLCAVGVLAKVIQPPGQFKPGTNSLPSTVVMPTDTPTWTPSPTPPPTETPVPSPTLRPTSPPESTLPPEATQVPTTPAPADSGGGDIPATTAAP
ncbi:MAG TPA: hypothetical protein VMT34_02220 [Aggregatilineales bacterium]|nr:hypothetical protein [Aggregatilineales bacterium]